MSNPSQAFQSIVGIVGKQPCNSVLKTNNLIVKLIKIYKHNVQCGYDKNKDTKKIVIDDKKLLCYEMIPLSLIQKYLAAIGLQVKDIYFSSLNQSLGYDGKFILVDSSEVTIQITRAFTSAKDGQQENLRQEHLAKKGWAPGQQDIIYSGTQRNRIFAENHPEVQVDLCTTKIPNALENAWLTKNKQQDKGEWLVITLPSELCLDSEDFFVACSSFWKRVQLNNKFKRIFIVNEACYTNGDPEEKLLENIWDSENAITPKVRNSASSYSD